MFSYLIYISRAKNPMSHDDIAGLLQHAQLNNMARDITGMLLYIEGDFPLNHKGGRFIQVLEGNETDVNDAFDVIKQDERHSNVLVINQSTSKLRNFKNWSMGFKYFDHLAFEKLEGSFDLADIFLKPKKSGQLNVPISFLKSFYNMGAGSDTL